MLNRDLLRSLWGLVLIVALAGCGGSRSNDISGQQGGPGGGGGGGGLVPPGTIINNGSGAVGSEADAIDRVMEQFFGLPVQAQVLAREVRTGSGGSPLVNGYIVPGGPFGAGTSVTDADDPDLAFTLDQPYYLFWIDPNPLANLGHSCFLLYLRASDGLLVQQPVDFDPLIAGVRPLVFDSSKAANLIYTHEFWRDLGLTPAGSGLAPQVARTRAQSVGDPGGPAIGGLGVAGAPEGRRALDLDLAEDLFRDMGGDPNTFDTLDDDEDDRIDSSDLEEALAEASEGLGPDDKFLFVLSSHGSTDGTFSLGEEFISWQTLCELIDQNVTAGNVNLVIDTCYSGLAVPVFEQWEGQAGKRVRILTSTGPATPSYSKGAGINLGCVIEKLQDKLLELGTDLPGTLTLDEIEQAMAEIEVSDEEIDAKVCAAIGDVPGADPDPVREAFKDDYLDDDEDEVQRSSGSRKGGFDDRPPPPDPIGGFLSLWSQRLQAKDIPGMQELYVDDFTYDGQDVITINQLGGLATFVDVSVLNIRSTEPLGTDSFFDVTFDLELTRSLAGPPTVVQDEEREVRMRLEPVGESFEIRTQQGTTQVVQGTLTIESPPPLGPDFPTIESVTITGPNGPITAGDTVTPGEEIVVTAVLSGLVAPPGSAGLGFGGQFHTLAPVSGNNYATAPFVAPNVPSGFFLFTTFVENRNVVIAGQQEAFSGRSQSVEVVTP